MKGQCVHQSSGFEPLRSHIKLEESEAQANLSFHEQTIFDVIDTRVENTCFLVP